MTNPAWQLRAEAWDCLWAEKWREAPAVNPFDRYPADVRHAALALGHERALYRLYLRSDAWRAQRRTVIAAAGGACQRCGRSFLVRLDVHHVTYDRIGDEDLQDLMAVCRPCHDELEDDRAGTHRSVAA